MAETQQPIKTYRGNCHCGSFVFEIKVPDINLGYECNCSICTKKGYCAIFTPAEEDGFTVVKGDEKDLKEYSFGNRAWIHKFCSNCGTGLMGRNESAPAGKNRIVNIRTLQQPFDFWSIEKKLFDAKSIPPMYEAPVYTGPEPKAGPEDGKVYHGSCHCGAVRLAVKCKPLESFDITKEEEKIVECNCSICQRGAYIWIYPHKDQTELQGADNLTYYAMGSRLWGVKGFCKTCGVHIVNEMNPKTDEEIRTLPESARTFYVRVKDHRPINLRVLDDIDVAKLETKKIDGYHGHGPSYVNP